MKRLLLSNLVAIAALGLGACGSNECKLDDPSSCPTDMACEVVQGREKPACFAPVQLEGKVFDLESSEGLSGARVTALDVNGAPVGAIATSGEGGTYTLRVPTDRADEKGTPIARKLTLRAAAKDYQAFPSGLRVAIPIDMGAAGAKEEGAPWVVAGGQADIGLAALPSDQRGHPSISGKVEVTSDQRGVLVVAERTDVAGISAVADARGDFVLFNVPPGTWSVRAYSRGVNYTPGAATVEAGKDLTGLEIKRSAAGTATVTGSVQIVAGSGETSIVMVPASTFNENLARGEVPPGLRAPEPGTAPNVDGAFSIEGVPDGEYYVLAAFENDLLVRDPDPSISGTQLQRLTVTNGAASAQPSFKVTSALTMVSPGAGDALEDTSATPTFTFKPYSSAKFYDVLVFDTFGNQVWASTGLQLATSGDLSVQYAGPALSAGQIYQWRGVARDGQLNPLTQTEDLKGVFRVK